jgi:hypothetical protein
MGKYDLWNGIELSDPNKFGSTHNLVGKYKTG